MKLLRSAWRYGAVLTAALLLGGTAATPPSHAAMPAGHGCAREAGCCGTDPGTHLKAWHPDVERPVAAAQPVPPAVPLFFPVHLHGVERPAKSVQQPSFLRMLREGRCQRTTYG